MLPLWVALAGGLGAVARFAADTLVARLNPGRVPLGTAFVNVTGSAFIGLLAGYSAVHSGADVVKAVLATGFCGGYTTFRAASVEAVRLLRGGRPTLAAVHAGGMAVLGWTAAFAGMWLGSLLP